MTKKQPSKNEPQPKKTPEKKKLDVDKESIELDEESLDDAAGGADTNLCNSRGCWDE